MKKNNKKVIFWVDNLGLCSLLSVWKSARNIQKYTVYYKEINPVVNNLLKFINQGHCFKPLEYSLDNMKTQDDIGLFYKINRDVINIVKKTIDRIYKKNAFASHLIRFPQDKTKLYLIQRLTLQIQEIILLINVVEYYCQNDQKISDSANIIVSRSADILGEFIKGKDSGQLQIISYWSMANFSFRRSTFRISLEFLGQVFRFFLTFIFPKRPIRSEAPSAKIGIYCSQKIDLNERSVLFWVPHSPVEFKRVVVYFENSHRPVTEKIAKLLSEYGVDWLVLRSKASKLGKKNLWKLPLLNNSQLFIYLKNAWRIIFSLLFRSGYLKLWQWYALVELLIQTYYYQTFYQDNNIKVLFNMDENAWVSTTKTIAMELTGGISVSSHWSHYVESLDMTKAYDVFFVWGSTHADCFKKSVSCFRRIIQCGYIYDYRFSEARVKSSQLRQQLKEAGVSYIIGFMDNAVGKDLPNSKEELIKLYCAFLNLVISNNKLGIILKPKRPDESVYNLVEMQQLLNKAMATRRCLIVNKNNLESFSFDAGLACDLNIGLGVSTTTVENVLAGIKSVDYDASSRWGSLVHNDGYNKIVFDDLDILINSIKKYVDAPEKNNEFANHGSILHKFDPFRDGKAAERIGFYMNELLMALDDHLAREDAIERASQKYQERYGNDKVDKSEKQFVKSAT